jgi:hypothetical protein
MTILREPLIDISQTGKRMYDLVEMYHTDLYDISVMLHNVALPVNNITLEQWFDIVKNIPYKEDKEPIEVVARPKIILQQWKADCKKKSILIGSYLRCRYKAFRFIACSERKDREVHHVFTQGFLSGAWRNLDATYPEYEIFDVLPVTYQEVLQ